MPLSTDDDTDDEMDYFGEMKVFLAVVIMMIIIR